MFTGIVQAKVPLAWVQHSPSFSRYALTFPSALLEGLSLGASVSVDGICQTVVAIENQEVTFEAIKETLACTTVGAWKQGDWVNIERSLKMGDEVGGHLVSGHIIGTAEIKSIEQPTIDQSILTLTCHPAWMKYLLPKGYVALNGVSLTIGKTNQSGWFTVNLIPETRKITTFGEAKIGDKINLEIDNQTQVIVDTVERVLNHSPLSGGSSLGS